MAHDHKNSPAALQGAISKQHSQTVILPVSVNLTCTSNIKGLVTTVQRHYYVTLTLTKLSTCIEKSIA